MWGCMGLDFEVFWKGNKYNEKYLTSFSSVWYISLLWFFGSSRPLHLQLTFVDSPRTYPQSSVVAHEAETETHPKTVDVFKPFSRSTASPSETGWSVERISIAGCKTLLHKTEMLPMLRIFSFSFVNFFFGGEVKVNICIPPSTKATSSPVVLVFVSSCHFVL